MYLNICHDLFEGISPNIPPDHERYVGTRCSDYERAATRTIRSEHSSWHDPGGADKNTNITTDFVPGRYLVTISSKLYKIKWPSQCPKNSLNSKHQTQFRCSRPGSTFDTQAKQLLRLGNTQAASVDIQNHMRRFCLVSVSHQDLRLAIRENMNQISAVIYPGPAGRGIHNINNIRCRRSSQPRTMINIAFCFQAWGFQFLYKPRNLRTENAKSLSHTHRFLLEAIILG